MATMDREETIRQVCSIVALAYRAKGDYSLASDGFCNACAEGHGPGWTYQNNGQAVEYVRAAVVAQLRADGLSIPDGWDENGVQTEWPA